ncbi:MAG: DNA (cytosine-5-)-methyltransferase [Magnetococcus sp. DMHC-1]
MSYSVESRNRFLAQAPSRTFYEFFAGGGMARIGIGPDWTCLFANDISAMKAACYRRYFGDEGSYVVGDVATVETSQLPECADLVWASFPCQDLSLAGSGAGLGGTRSGTFWPFWNLMLSLRRENRAPRLIVLENVYGTITSRRGGDLASILGALADGGYKFGPLVIDAVHFLPQSRPRLFILAVDHEVAVPGFLFADGPNPKWHPGTLNLACDVISGETCSKWIWWNLADPHERRTTFADLIEHEPVGVTWHSQTETMRLLDMMSPINRKKVEEALHSGIRRVGGLYKRTRKDVNGIKRQRAEVRFDDVAGCLRTPTGGSSRQTIIIVENDWVRSRLLSPREAARLMGLPENYMLPIKYNDAYHLAGDGVAVPVVRHLVSHIVEPILDQSRQSICKDAA